MADIKKSSIPTGMQGGFMTPTTFNEVEPPENDDMNSALPKFKQDTSSEESPIANIETPI